MLINDNLTFRAFKYPADYLAFDGRDLSKKGYIENNPDENYCAEITPTNDLSKMQTKIYPNPATNLLHLSWDAGKIITIDVFDKIGRLVLSEKGNGGMHFMDVSELESGVYFVRFGEGAIGKVVIFN